MTDPYFNLQSLSSDFQTAYDAVMYGSRLSSNDCVQKNAVAFGQQVKQASPNDYLNTLVPEEHGYHNQFSYTRFRLEVSENLPSSTSESSGGAEASGAVGNIFTSPPKHTPVTTLDFEELCQEETSEASVKSKKADSGGESEIKIVQVRSIASEEGSHFVNNSHQDSNIQTGPIIQSDNLESEFVRRSLTKKSAIRRQHIHKDKKTHKCKVCDKYFIQKSGLLLHRRIHTGEKLFECEQCNRCFTQKGNLIAHRRTHTGEKPFECEQCNKCFSQKGNLITHRLTHTVEKSNECKQCGMYFVRKHALQTHQRIHTGEKYYTCNQCDKIFAQKRYLATHQQTHTDVKPHKCGQCDHRFSLKSYLKMHQRTHTNLKPFKCKQCDKGFSRKTYLAMHQRNHMRKLGSALNLECFEKELPNHSFRIV